MSDNFQDSIRERAQVDLSLNVCEYLKRYHADTIRQLWRKTESTGREHSSAMWIDDGRPAAYNPNIGKESSIAALTPPDDHSLGRVNITVHTHPSNTLALSVNDFRSLSGKLQFPPERVDWVGEPTVRGIAVVSRRLKEDEISVRGWTGLPAHTTLSIEEQQEVYSSFSEEVRDADPIKRGLVAEKALSDIATACMEQVEP